MDKSLTKTKRRSEGQKHSKYNHDEAFKKI